MQYLMPLVAGLVAWWAMGETFTGTKIAGAALTLAGVAWAQYSSPATAPARAAEAQID
jgi:drug/metabolite transporter (DMT)-like permease